MPISDSLRNDLKSSSWIRKMYEIGLEMKNRLGKDSVFDFSLGNPDLDPPNEFTEKLIQTVSSRMPGMHGYMTGAGLLEAREAMSQKVNEEHLVTTTANDIIMTSGAAGALNTCLKTIINPNDEIIVIKPFFSEYAVYVNNFNGSLAMVDSKPDFSLDLHAIEKALTPKTAGIIINSPNNPTGRIYPNEDITGLSEILSKHGKQCGKMPYLIADEPYRDIVYDGNVVPSVLNTYTESIVVSSFSKSLSVPGERIGYIAVNPDCDEKNLLVTALIHTNRTLGFVNAPAIMQRVIAQCWRTIVDINRYKTRRDMLSDVLNEAGISFAKPDGAFYLFCKVPEKKSADGIDFAMLLKEHSIIAVPGIGFGSPMWVRLCYCVPETVIEGSRKHFIEAIAEWKQDA